MDNQNDKGLKTKVFPNPFKNTLSILIEGGTGTTDFFLYNDLGQAILHTTWDLAKSIHEYSISTAKLSDGIYFYKIVNSEQTSRGKVVKVTE